MATTSLLKPSQLLFSNRRQNFHGNPCCIRSANFITGTRVHSFKVKSFLDSTSSSSTSKNNTVAFPFNFEAKTGGSINPKGNIYEEGVISTFFKTLKWLKVPAVVILLLFLTMCGRDPALAARSGGAKGGSSFSSSSKLSSSSSSSRSSSSRSSSSSSGSSSSSYGSSSDSESSRWGGIMGGHSFSSSSSSSKPSSSSSSSSWPSSSSSSSSSLSRRHESSPSRQYSSSTSYHDPYKSSSSSSPDWYSSSSYYTSSYSPSATQLKPSKPEDQQRDIFLEGIELLLKAFFIFLALLAFYCMFSNWEKERENRTRVIKLQVGLHVRGPSFERTINRIAETADTSTVKGLIYVLQETTEALRTHFASCVAVDSSVKVNESVEKAEEYFKKLSLEEREKFDKDTFINLNNIKSQNISEQKDDILLRDTYMVVTILVAAKGEVVLNFPKTIASSDDLKKALKELQTISKSADQVQAVNVVWTPQDENEVMSREELYQVYPVLRGIGGEY